MNSRQIINLETDTQIWTDWFLLNINKFSIKQLDQIAFTAESALFDKDDSKF